ncbi:MAG TPA: bifunctional glutamate N-acetyltransferase/amino-acid acetyltransferase ArgJ [Methanoregulaceae archaeon]|nr:bifunctional glutamate N-acetyltransferase/amino-acid acetyltransferase ArgJ [Methanoregulaceae archaeon]
MKSICAIEGVTAAGIKEGKYGLALIRASGETAGVFTRNLMKAPPIRLMEERIRKGWMDAVIVNSGCANAYTGSRGYQDAITMAGFAADVLELPEESVGVASTGVIGRFLDLDRIRDQCTRIAPFLERSERAEEMAARAIMTTDLSEKHSLVEGDGFLVGGITKGSGMIAPNMATMLAFIYTDADLPLKEIRESLKLATERTFNRVVVDGDTSTNDCALLTSTGRAGRVDRSEFQEVLERCCRQLAVQIASDGEGASKLLEVRVKGAPSEDQAARVARTIAESPLVKTAVYGEDPNWGRVIAAAGRAGVEFDPDSVSLCLGNGRIMLELVRRGEIVVDLPAAKAVMAGKTVIFELDLDNGDGSATGWGCDLTEKYVEINGRYTT